MGGCVRSEMGVVATAALDLSR
ncbi:hypothetical protein A2U01_0072903, partial [Trifolium medium]|nr:hypothetical protein [Trifolium medium]